AYPLSKRPKSNGTVICQAAIYPYGLLLPLLLTLNPSVTYIIRCRLIRSHPLGRTELSSRKQARAATGVYQRSHQYIPKWVLNTAFRYKYLPCSICKWVLAQRLQWVGTSNGVKQSLDGRQCAVQLHTVQRTLKGCGRTGINTP